MISITDYATEKIKEVLNANPVKHVRVVIQGGG